MAEAVLLRRSPLAGLGLDAGSSSVALVDPGPAARFILRGGDAAADHAGQAFGTALPRKTCRASFSGDRAALWLGPDEWLLIAAPDHGPDIAAALAQALAAVPHALVEIGHRQAALELRGPRAAEALNAGCPLDLDLSAFLVGMCTRTLFAKAEIVLWRTDDEAFRIEAWRSFVPYVHGLLMEAVGTPG